MKKSRPGHLVKVICKPEDAEAIAERLARETGTLGVRHSGASHRWIAERDFETVTLSIDGGDHEVTVKVASTADGDVYDVSAEYDDAAEVAETTGLPDPGRAPSGGARGSRSARRGVDADRDDPGHPGGSTRSTTLRLDAESIGQPVGNAIGDALGGSVRVRD